MKVADFKTWVEDFKSKTNYKTLLNSHELAVLFETIDSLEVPAAPKAPK
jgi:hypothetical protein